MPRSASARISERSVTMPTGRPPASMTTTEAMLRSFHEKLGNVTDGSGKA